MISFINYKQLADDTKDWCKYLPKDIMYVIGIPRSGMIVASIIAEQLNTKLGYFDKDKKKIVIMPSGITRKVKELEGKILVVDDSINSGNSLSIVKDICKNNVLYGAVYYTKESESMINYKHKLIEHPRLFEWNLFHSGIISKSCVDIDGFLCDNPTELENDDSENYKSFILNAKCKIVPTYNIGCLVTCRLDKYRNETMKWLDRNNIKYNGLIMMQYKTKKERQMSGDYANYKAYIYNNSDAVLFIESSVNQAITIARLTNKPVLCTDNMTLYQM